MRIQDLIAHIKHELMQLYTDPILAEQSAWWLVEALTGRTKASLLAHETLRITPEQHAQALEWLRKMIQESMPLQYLLGSVPFNNLTILVESPILIPRPETEEWCMWLVNRIEQCAPQHFTVLDLCSGTGCIALTLASHFPQAQAYATDINEAAVKLGIKNARHNKLTNVTFLQSDLYQQLPQIKFDLIVANPPYIKPADWQSLDRSVKDWEDKRALIADDEGLALIKVIIAQAPFYLKNNQDLARAGVPSLMLEIDYDQAAIVVDLMRNAHFDDICVHKDLEGKDRVVSGRLKDVAFTSSSS